MLTGKQLGFTLIELLIAISISAIIGVLLMTVLIQQNGVFFAQSTKVSQGLSLIDINSTIQQDLRSASRIELSILRNSVTYSSNQHGIVLALPSLDNNGNIISDTYDYLVIYRDSLDNTQLKRRLFKDASSSRNDIDQVLTTKMSGINVAFLNDSQNPVAANTATRVKIDLSVMDTVGLNDQTQSIIIESNLRND